MTRLRVIWFTRHVVLQCPIRELKFYIEIRRFRTPFYFHMKVDCLLLWEMKNTITLLVTMTCYDFSVVGSVI